MLLKISDFRFLISKLKLDVGGRAAAGVRSTSAWVELESSFGHLRRQIGIFVALKNNNNNNNENLGHTKENYFKQKKSSTFTLSNITFLRINMVFVKHIKENKLKLIYNSYVKH